MRSRFHFLDSFRQFSKSEWAWLLFFISLPAGRPFTTYTLILLVAASLPFIRKIHSGNFGLCMKHFWPLLLFFFLHITGLLYTDDFSFAFKDLSVKLPLVIVPLVAALTGISENLKSKSALAFSLSCVAANAFLLAVACFHFLNGTQDAFFYNIFSFYIHPAYMAMMNSIAIAVFLSAFRKPDGLKKNFLILCLMLLSVNVILMASKSGILSMMMVYLFHFFRIRYRQHKLKTILSAGLIIFISAITIVFSPAGNRVSEALKVIRHPDKATSLQESTASRLLAWKTAWQIGHDYFPLGTGTGDIKEVTLAYYEKSGYQWPLYYKLNAHNQFLQSFAALGIAGLGTLICILWLPVFFRKTDDLPTVIFPVLLFINFLFESMLEVQNGVMMITAFYVFFASFPAKNSGK
jgi:hypothetical protein